jgi:hypothetical protein
VLVLEVEPVDVEPEDALGVDAALVLPLLAVGPAGLVAWPMVGVVAGVVALLGDKTL